MPLIVRRSAHCVSQVSTKQLVLVPEVLAVGGPQIRRAALWARELKCSCAKIRASRGCAQLNSVTFAHHVCVCLFRGYVLQRTWRNACLCDAGDRPQRTRTDCGHRRLGFWRRTPAVRGSCDCVTWQRRRARFLLQDYTLPHLELEALADPLRPDLRAHVRGRSELSLALVVSLTRHGTKSVEATWSELRAMVDH